MYAKKSGKQATPLTRRRWNQNPPPLLIAVRSKLTPVGTNLQCLYYSSWHWRCSGMGVLHERATASPKLRACGSPWRKTTLPVGGKLIAPWNTMHSVTIILKTRRKKAELHIKGIHKVCIQFVFKVDFLLWLSSYVGSENGKFLTPKVLAERPNLQEWWVGEKNAATMM